MNGHSDIETQAPTPGPLARMGALPSFTPLKEDTLMPVKQHGKRPFVYVVVACAIAVAAAFYFQNDARDTRAHDEGHRSMQFSCESSRAAEERTVVVVPGDDPDMEARFGRSAVDVPGTATGVIFINGRYIDAPYRVVRRGLAIYVNDIRVERLQWPSRFYQRDDPPLPPGIDRDSKLADIEDWMQLKARYYSSNVSPSEALQETIKAYRSLPCVKTVELERDEFVTTMKIVLHSGEVRELFGNEEIDLRPMPEHVVERTLERYMEYWQGLAGTRGLLYHARGRELGYPNHTATWFALPEIVAILRTDQPPEQKAAALHPFFSEQFSDPEQLRLFLRPLLTDFEGTPQLDARLELIRKEREARQK